MFGVYRTLLALIIAIHHLTGVSHIADYAVNGFFILSGFLMTHIMHESYGYARKGVGAFALNRFLRLFPAYWVVLALSLLMYQYVGQDYAEQFNQAMYFPITWQQWGQNIFMLFTDLFPSEQLPRISPPAWALTIELLFYVLIAFGLSRNKKMCWVWVGASALYMLVTHWVGYEYKFRYGTIAAGSLPFAIGSIIYHYEDVLGKYFRHLTNHHWSYLLFVVFLLNAYIGLHGGREWLSVLTYYVNFAIHILIVINLWLSRSAYIKPKLDRFIGEFSYPIYLIHWQCGLFVSAVIAGKPELSSMFVSTSICLTILLSWLVIMLVEHPVEIVRQRVKNAVAQPKRCAINLVS